MLRTKKNGGNEREGPSKRPSGILLMQPDLGKTQKYAGDEEKGRFSP